MKSKDKIKTAAQVLLLPQDSIFRTPINRGNGLIMTSLRVLRKAYGKTEYFNP